MFVCYYAQAQAAHQGASRHVHTGYVRSQRLQESQQADQQLSSSFVHFLIFSRRGRTRGKLREIKHLG